MCASNQCSAPSGRNACPKRARRASPMNVLSAATHKTFFGSACDCVGRSCLRPFRSNEQMNKDPA